MVWSSGVGSLIYPLQEPGMSSSATLALIGGLVYQVHLPFFTLQKNVCVYQVPSIVGAIWLPKKARFNSPKPPIQNHQGAPQAPSVGPNSGKIKHTLKGLAFSGLNGNYH